MGSMKKLLLALFLITMAESREDLEAMVEEIRRELSERLDLNEKLLLKTQEELKKTQEKLLTRDIELEKYMTATRQELYSIRAPPHMHACGANHDQISSTSQTIPYTNIFYNATTTEGGGLNAAAGTFTSSWPGSYSVTWSLTAYGDNAIGGRSLVVRLEQDDTLDLFCVDCS